MIPLDDIRVVFYRDHAPGVGRGLDHNWFLGEQPRNPGGFQFTLVLPWVQIVASVALMEESQIQSKIIFVTARSMVGSMGRATLLSGDQIRLHYSHPYPPRMGPATSLSQGEGLAGCQNLYGPGRCLGSSNFPTGTRFHGSHWLPLHSRRGKHLPHEAV
jgi:hypothetical protein